jgi:ABC-2 type transport system permease protein
VAFDAIPEMGIFLRTRVPRVERILAPRVIVTMAAVTGSFVIGALVAWYETWALIGAPDATAVLAGIAYGSLFMVFVVALVTAIAGRTSSVLATVMVSILVLLLLPIVGIADRVGRWLPTHLAGALGALPAGTAEPVDYLGAAGVTVVLVGVLIWLGTLAARRREL